MFTTVAQRNKLHIMLNIKTDLRKWITQTSVIHLALLPETRTPQNRDGGGQLCRLVSMSVVSFDFTDAFRMEITLQTHTSKSVQHTSTCCNLQLWTQYFFKKKKTVCPGILHTISPGSNRTRHHRKP